MHNEQLNDDVHEVPALGEDLIVGATAIARELNWKTKDGSWDRRRVYHVCEHGTLPIHHVKGLGICSRKSSLRTLFERLDEPFLNREQSRYK